MLKWKFIVGFIMTCYCSVETKRSLEFEMTKLRLIARVASVGGK